MKRNTAWLAIILLLSIGLRCIGLGSRGIWYDDAFSFFLARQPLSSVIAGTAADTMPPLYYFLLHFWMRLGQQIWMLRLVGLVFSVGAIYLLYAITSALFNPRTGVWAAFLAAISPFQIYHAQELRPYTLLAFTELGYAWCFIRIWQKREQARWPVWAGLVLFGAAAMYTHNLAAFALVVPDIYLLARRDWKLLRKIIQAQVAIFLLALPWLVYLPGQMAKISGGWSIPRPGLAEVMQTLIMLTSNLPLPGIWLAVGLLISLWTLALLAFELVRKPEREPGLFLLGAFALAPPLLMLAVSYVTTPVYVTRGFIVSHLTYAAIAGYVIAKTWPRMGVFFVGMFVAGAAICLPYQITFDEFPRSPYEQAGAYLEQSVQPGDRVIHDNKLSYFPMHYYHPNLEGEFIQDEAGGHNDTLSDASEQALQIYPAADLSTAAGDARRVFFVVYTRAIEEYRSVGEPDHPSLAWLRQDYHQVGHTVFNDLEVYQFERPGAKQ